MLLVCLLWLPVPAGSDESEATAAPEPSPDQVTWRKSGEVRERISRGTIGDISGASVVMKRGTDRLDVIPLREVVRLQWNTPVAYDAAMAQLRAKDFDAATRSFEQALTGESREWAVREILAMKARALTMQDRTEGALEIVEQIHRSDPQTRHLIELPLVWDERVPVERRPRMTADDLTAPSPLRQLVASSVLLDHPDLQAQATAVLRTLSTSPHSRLQQLAERQLWRRELLHPDGIHRSTLAHRTQQVQSDDRRLRAISEFLLGRAWLKQGDFDRAVSSLLWLPLLEPFDPITTQLAADDAVSALQHAGFPEEAAALRQELQAPEPAAARESQAPPPRPER
jgi:tetratricopeptide (TPR) repeat protein